MLRMVHEAALSGSALLQQGRGIMTIIPWHAWPVPCVCVMCLAQRRGGRLWLRLSYLLEAVGGSLRGQHRHRRYRIQRKSGSVRCATGHSAGYVLAML